MGIAGIVLLMPNLPGCDAVAIVGQSEIDAGVVNLRRTGERDDVAVRAEKLHHA